MKDYQTQINTQFLLQASVLLVGKTTYPFQAGREAGSTTASETRGLDLVDDPIVTLENDFLSLVPIAHLLRARKVGGIASVEVLENAILVLETSVMPDGIGILNGSQTPHSSP